MDIKACIFDVFGTLVDWRTGVAQEVRSAFQGHPVDVDAYQFAMDWRAEYQPSMTPIRDGERPYVPVDQLHLENLDRVLNKHGLTHVLNAKECHDLNRAWEKLPPWPDVISGLSLLQQKHILAPCSNASIALMVHMSRFARFRWDCILGADIARDYKPKPEVYLASCAALSLRPEQVLMVACHNDDLEAARAAGLRTGFYPRAEEYGPNQTKNLTAEQRWDFVAENLVDLARQIG